MESDKTSNKDMIEESPLSRARHQPQEKGMEQLTFEMCQIGVRHIICLNNDKLTLAPLQSKKRGGKKMLKYLCSSSDLSLGPEQQFAYYVPEKPSGGI